MTELRAPESLESERILFRKPGPDNAESMFKRYAGDPDVGEFLAWRIHRSIDDTRAFLKFSDGEWQQSPCGPYLLFSKNDGHLLGSSGLAFESAGCASTGYVLARDAWGHGFATEAVTQMKKLSVKLGVERLYALCHPDHYPSRRVLEKCNFKLEGTIRGFCIFPNRNSGKLEDVVSYARVKKPG